MSNASEMRQLPKKYRINFAPPKKSTERFNKELQMPLPNLPRNISLSCLVFALIMSAGCASLKPEPTYIVVKPKAEPLSETTLQAMRPNSTDSLKRAYSWSENSRRLLNSVTEK
jgi:hypothetical protein